MRDLDLTPLMRNAIGFDRMARLLDSALSDTQNTSYPPYNIEQIDEHNYQISMAVAGFSESEINIEVQENQLKITARKDAQDNEDQRQFLHRGIAQRAFERRFSLAEHIKVAGALLEHGLLHIKLEREIPEEKKPVTIQIKSKNPKILN